MAKDSFKICYKCGLEERFCYCHAMPLLENRDRVVLLTTRRETYIRSNTGRLIVQMLSNKKQIFMGEKGWEEDLKKEIEDPNYFPILFYPYPSAKGAKTLKSENTKPLNIILLDTNWRGSRKWIYKDCLIGLQKAELKNVYKSSYLLRNAPADNYLCTLQALASFFIEMDCEHSLNIANKMTETYEVIIQKMLYERGRQSLYLSDEPE